jgi:hypothetical protein
LRRVRRRGPWRQHFIAHAYPPRGIVATETNVCNGSKADIRGASPSDGFWPLADRSLTGPNAPRPPFSSLVARVCFRTLRILANFADDAFVALVADRPTVAWLGKAAPEGYQGTDEYARSGP